LKTTASHNSYGSGGGTLKLWLTSLQTARHIFSGGGSLLAGAAAGFGDCVIYLHLI